MTLIVVIMAYGGALLLTSAVENTSLAATFQWIMNGAQGQAPGSNTGGNGNTTGPQTTPGTPPGSVIFVGNPFLGA